MFNKNSQQTKNRGDLTQLDKATMPTANVRFNSENLGAFPLGQEQGEDGPSHHSSATPSWHLS